MAQVEFLDGILKEYMIFRGFSNTLKSLEIEQRNEKEKSFRSEKIMEQFNVYISSHELQSLRDLWSHLDNNLFSKLEHSYSLAVKKLENGLLKLYLVTAHNNNRLDKITEFFSKLASELHSQSEWKEWFYFSFCKNPEESPLFQLYFTKQWQDTLQISLRNFLTTIYQCMPQPTFVRAEHEAILLRRLQEENASLKLRLQSLSNPQTAQATTNATGGGPVGVTTGAISNESYKRGRGLKQNSTVQSLNDITPFDISPPGHIVDDFYNIATETLNVAQYPEMQARGLKLLIKNIGSSSSPVLGRKESTDKTKRRSGSVGRSWM